MAYEIANRRDLGRAGPLRETR